MNAFLFFGGRGGLALKGFLFSLLIVFSLFLFGCLEGSKSVSELKQNPDAFAGKEVVLRGSVERVLRVGDLSGFSLRDEANDSIPVAWKGTLYAEGTPVVVRGTVQKLLGVVGGPVFIQASSVEKT
ncbi:MAG: hypothetical protein ACP5IG_04250 [Candidatus Micrarchaeia archaeon]